MNFKFNTKLKQEIPVVIDFFEKALYSNKIFHAYLLTGKNHEIKENFCLEIAKILNCKSQEKPCNQCQNCNWINQASHPEVPISLTVEADSKEIKVKQIETLLKKLSNKSLFYRIIIMNPADEEFLSKQSANILLKTIEEPHERTIFFFLAEDYDSVLATIKSRCQIINFPEFKDLTINSFAIENNFGEITNNYFKVSEFVKNLKISNLDFLKNLYNFCLNKFIESHNPFWLNKLEKIEIAQNRIIALCNEKYVIEELLFNF